MTITGAARTIYRNNSPKIRIKRSSYGALLALLLMVAVPPAARAQGWGWQNPLPRGGVIGDIVALGTNFAVAVCDDGNALVTYDMGRNWHRKPLAYSSLDRVHCFGDSIVIAAGQNGLIVRSTDWGWTWRRIREGSVTAGYLTDLAGIDDSSAVVKMGYDELFVTTDRGLNWERRAMGVAPDQVRSVFIQSPTLWWANTGNALYRSGDAGATWKRDTSLDARGLARLVYVDSLFGWQVRDGRVLRTRDGGVTWTEMDIYGFEYNLDVFTTGTDRQTVFILSDGQYVVNKSTDGGETWNISLTAAAFPESSPYAGAFTSESVGYIAGDGGRILRSSDGGESWAIVHGAGFLGSIAQVLFQDPRNGAALTHSNTVLVTSNGGARWDETVPAAGYTIRKASMYNRQEGYGFGFDKTWQPYLFRASDQGRTWTLAGSLPISYDPQLFAQPEGIFSVSRDTVLIGVSYGVLLLSTDAGVSWDSILVNREFASQYGTGRNMFVFPPGRIVYVGGNGIGRSADFGRTWDYSWSPNRQYISSSQFVSPLKGFALLSGPGGSELYRTTDGGVSWEILPKTGFQLFQFFNEHDAIAIGTGGDGGSVIYKTYNGGSDWSEFPLKERVAWSGWTFLNSDLGWAWGYSGEIRNTSNGGLASGGSAPQAPGDPQIGAPYPNPFSISRHSAMSVPIALPSREISYSLTIFDALGRLSPVLPSAARRETARTGTFEESFILQSLKPGMYILRLFARGRTHSRAFLVVK